MNPSFTINERPVGWDHDPLIVAEIGINHGGDLDIACAMAGAAIAAGADVVKHQTHVVEDEMTGAAKHRIPGNASESIYSIMERCALNENDEWKLKEYVEERGGIFLSTPFSRAAADRLIRFDVPAFKIGSGECNNIPLIAHVAKAGKPILLSTGMNDIGTIAEAVAVIEAHCIPYALLHCTNVYPTPPHLVRLGAIQELEKRFPDAVIGLSDHTVNNLSCLGAVALGASVIERHFTDSPGREGPDIACSMDPEQLAELREMTRTLREMRGGRKGAVAEEEVTMDFAFASVCAIRAIAKGEPLSTENIWVKRPRGGDYSPGDFAQLLGKRAARDIPLDRQLTFNDVDHED